MKQVLIGLALVFSFSARADVTQEIVTGRLMVSPIDRAAPTEDSLFFSGYELKSITAQGSPIIYDVLLAGNPCGRGISRGALMDAGTGADVELNGFVENGSNMVDEGGILHQEFMMQVMPDGERLHVVSLADGQP